MAARTVSSASASSGSAATAGPSSSSSRVARASSPATSLLTPTAGLTSASARSRHSLYGAEDRVVLDIGSRVWKIGFSGESTPRAVFDVGELWTYDAVDAVGSKEQQRQCHRTIKKLLRRVYYDELMTDSKARKVIVLENPLLPLRIKQTVAKILFEHLQVPSLSFALSPLCALLSIGRATGLVVDVGNLETCLLPIYASRPLFSHLRTTPIASRRLSHHLRDLLKRFAIYTPHSSSSSVTTSSRQPQTGSSSTSRRIISPVPDEVLTMAVVEEIKTRACFVDPDMPEDGPSTLSSSDKDKPYIINSCDYVSTASSEADREAYSSFRHSRLKRKYVADEGNASEATTLTLRLPSGTLSIPGWLRHACTDIFFDSIGDVDEPSIPELVLDCLLKLAIDLRKVFISNILIIGGGSMLPGFPLRLTESIRTLLHRDKRYTSLRGLSRSICIVNCASRVGPTVNADQPNREPEVQHEEEDTSAAFAWERSLLAWVGASLVGAMKASGKEEWTRQAWDAAASSSSSAGSSAIDLGDWTRRGW